MRHTLLFPCLLIAVSLATPALAGSAYSKCVEVPDPPECIARRAVGSMGVEPSMVLESILRHGLVDQVPAKSGKLVRGLYEVVGQPDEKIDTPEEQMLDSSAAEALRKAPRKSALAAMALVAAARHQADPFTNPVYLKLARQAKDDPRIPLLALSLWTEVVGMSGSPPDFSVEHAGLAAIWDRAVARKEQDLHLLADIAGTLCFLDELKPKAAEFFRWYAHQPGLTPAQRADAASRMADFAGMYEEGVALIAQLGEVEGYDMNGVRASVAAARLKQGYEAEAARLVQGEILDSLSRMGFTYHTTAFDKYDELENAGARKELREIGDECLRQAGGAGNDKARSNWYAAASDFYLRAGDRERAREIARLGLPYVAESIRLASDPHKAAVLAQGTGTAPVIALYRTGAIDEALKTRYLTGKDRYENAERAGEKKDPQWVLDDDWPLYIDMMAFEAADSTDREFQQKAYDGLVRSCKRPIADCFDETLRQIAMVAAGMGDEVRMKEALVAATRQLDKGGESGFRAVYVAGPWAHCEEVLRAARQRVARK